MMTTLHTTHTSPLLVAFLLVVGFAPPVQAQMRNTRLGNTVDSFSLNDIDGQEISYEHRPDRITFLTILAAYQKRSDRALADLTELVSNLRKDEHAVDLLIVISGGEGIEDFRSKRDAMTVEAPMLLDTDDALWGRLGVSVTPTTFLIDKQGIVTWIRAGHGYDFAAEAQHRSSLALGIEGVVEAAEGEPVQALVNDSDEDRAKRHLRMGQIHARKGDVESGIAELKKAQTLSPNSVTIGLELIRLLCRSGKAEQALAALEHITSDSRAEIARQNMFSGWAHRLLGDLEEAAALLTEAIALDPDLVRALFELGKIYEQNGEYKQAMETYRRALSVHFDENP